MILYPFQEELLQNDRMIMLTPRCIGFSTLVLNKLREIVTKNANRRICIISSNTNTTFFQVKDTFPKIENKTHSSAKIYGNWIHMLSPYQWGNVRGMELSDIFITDYDNYSPEQKEMVINMITIYQPKTLWINGTELQDKFICNMIKHGYKNYLLGKDIGMQFFAILNKENSMETIIEDSIEELHKRIG